MESKQQEVAIPISQASSEQMADVEEKPSAAMVAHLFCPCRLMSVNLGLILLNWVIYLGTRIYSQKTSTEFFCVLYNAGAAYGLDIQHYFHLHRLLFPIFLHGSWDHWAGNSLAMVLFGFEAEKALGHIWFIVLYLFAGVVASLLQVTVELEIPGIGASGAIMGLQGFIIMKSFSEMKTLKDSYNPLLRVFIVEALFLIIPQEGMGNYAHLGGLLIGILIGFMWYPSTARGLIPRRRIKIIYIFSICVGMIVTTLVLFLNRHPYIRLCKRTRT